MMHRHLKILLLMIVALTTTSCYYLKKTTEPVRHIWYQKNNHDTLVIFLPGIREEPENFKKHGAVEQLLECNPEVDIVAVDAHFKYYKERILVPRLKQDIIDPAKARGVTKIWMMGISLGGFGTTIYRQEQTSDLSGVILMAPFVGEWEDVDIYLNRKDELESVSNTDFIAVWDNIASTFDKEPAVTLAYGRQDKFSRQHQWLTELLPEERVVSVDGKHTWDTWSRLWPMAYKASGICQ